MIKDPMARLMTTGASSLISSAMFSIVIGPPTLMVPPAALFWLPMRKCALPTRSAAVTVSAALCGRPCRLLVGSRRRAADQRELDTKIPLAQRLPHGSEASEPLAKSGFRRRKGTKAGGHAQSPTSTMAIHWTAAGWPLVHCIDRDEHRG